MRCRRAAALALACALVFAGCSDGGEPKGDGTTLTPTSTPDEPSTSPAASEEPPSKPLPTAKEWFRRLSDGMLNGDTQPVRSITAETCVSCLSQISAVEETFREGGGYRFDTVAWRVVRAKLDRKSRGEAQVTVALSLSGGALTPSAGAEEVAFSKESRVAQLLLSDSGGRWLVSQLVFLT